MAKNIKFLYKKHISDTAPDMEKLWDRIEGQLENKMDKDQTQIKVSRRNYRKFVAAAASLVLIIGGVSLYADIRSESDSVSKHSVETADKARLENREEKTYEQLSFSHTDTKAYEDSYIPKGDDYFTEDSVLKDTDFFADVTVLSARLDSDSAHYTLKINSLVSKTGEESETNITIESSTPYIIGKTCYHAELLIVIFFICRNISQYVVFEKVNEKLQLLVEKLHSPPNCRTHILRHVVDFAVCCIGNKSQFLVLCTRDTAITLFRCIIRYQQCYQLSSVTSD